MTEEEVKKMAEERTKKKDEDEMMKKVQERLLDAILKADLKSVKFFLENGAEINARAKGRPKKPFPLHLAITENHIEIVKMLLQNGANVNIKKRDYSKSPLHLAVAENNIDIVKLLVQNGAQIDVKDNVATRRPGGKFQTPLDFALKKGYDNIVIFLKNPNKTEEEVWQMQACVDAEEKFKKFGIC